MKQKLVQVSAFWVAGIVYLSTVLPVYAADLGVSCDETACSYSTLKVLFDETIKDANWKVSRNVVIDNHTAEQRTLQITTKNLQFEDVSFPLDEHLSITITDLTDEHDVYGPKSVVDFLKDEPVILSTHNAYQQKTYQITLKTMFTEEESQTIEVNQSISMSFGFEATTENPGLVDEGARVVVTPSQVTPTDDPTPTPDNNDSVLGTQTNNPFESGMSALTAIVLIFAVIVALFYFFQMVTTSK